MDAYITAGSGAAADTALPHSGARKGDFVTGSGSGSSSNPSSSGGGGGGGGAGGNVQLPDLWPRIERLMRQRGFRNEYHLARMADLSNGTLTKLRTGKTADPTLSTLLKLARALRVTVAELIGEVEPSRSDLEERTLEQDLWAVSEGAIKQAGGGDVQQLFLLLKVFFDMPPEQRQKVEGLLVQAIELATGRAISDIIRMMGMQGTSYGEGAR